MYRREQQPTVVMFHDVQPKGTIVAQLRELGWRALDLGLTQGVVPRDCRPVGALVAKPVDQPWAAPAVDLGCPVVRLGMLPHAADDRVPAVLFDVGATGRLAAEHFAERRFRHIAFVGHDPWSRGEACFRAFEQRGSELGCAVHLLRLVSPVEEEGVERYANRRKAIADWISRVPKPLGLFLLGGRLAAGLSILCDDLRLAVPEQVAILGFGNDPVLCETAPVALSSVDPGFANRGREAVQLLRRLIAGEDVGQRRVLVPPVGVVERHSTHVRAVEDPVVAGALRVMWDNLEVDLSVDDIAAEMDVSRRSLERAFRRHLGRGVNAELRRKRLERVSELLISTELPVAEIGRRVGMPSKAHLHRLFRAAYRVTPGEYRGGARAEGG